MNKKIYSLLILIICFLCIFVLVACKDNNIVIDPDQPKIADGITIEYIDTSKFSFDSNTHATLTINYLTNADLIFNIEDFKYKVLYQDGTSEDILSSAMTLSITDESGAEVTGSYLPGRYTLKFKYNDFEKILNLVVNPININEDVITYRGIKQKYAYTGSEIMPIPTLYCGQKELIKDVDYSLAYTSNIEMGDALIHVVGMGVYTGERLIPFEITTLVVEGLDFEDLVLAYNGQNRKADLELDLVANPIEGVTNILYSYSKDGVPQSSVVNAGVYNVNINVITEIGYVDVDPINITITINPLSIEDCQIQDLSATYKATAYTVDDFSARLVKDSGNRDLLYDTDYSLSMGSGEGVDNINASSTTVHGKLIMQGHGNYYGTKEIDFQIERESLNNQAIDIAFTDLSNDFIYNGLEITRTYSSIKDTTINYVLTTDDYIASYENNINAGLAQLVITGKGNFKDSYVYEYEIAKQEIDTTSFSPNLEYTTYNATDRKADYRLTGADERFNYLEVEYTYSKDDEVTQDVKNVGDYYVNMTISVDSEHSNNYCININEKNAYLYIQKAQANVTASISATGYDYTGAKIIPTINVRWKGDALPYSQYQIVTSKTYGGEMVDSIDAGRYYIKLQSDNFSFDSSEFLFDINQIALPSNAQIEWPKVFRDVWQYNYKDHAPQGGSITINGEQIPVNYAMNYMTDDDNNILGVEINAIMKNYKTERIQVNNGNELISVVNTLGIVMRQNGVTLTASQMDSLSNLHMGDEIEVDVPQGYEIVYTTVETSSIYTNTATSGNTLREILGGARVDGNLCNEEKFRLCLNNVNGEPVATSKDVNIGRAIFDHYGLFENAYDLEPKINVLNQSTKEVDIIEGYTIKVGLDSSYSYTLSYHLVKTDETETDETEKTTAFTFITSNEVKKVVITIYNSNDDIIVYFVHNVVEEI